MIKAQTAARLETIFDSLTDVTVMVVADFLGAGLGGLPAVTALAAVGVTVFPVGVVGEDAAGQQILDALHAHHISTSGVDRIKKYETPGSDRAGNELIHGEHPALLNVVEHARKFASACEAAYVCDYGIGAASPRVLNFIKSNRCLSERPLAARSPHRLVDFEQLTTAISTQEELERAIGIGIVGDAQKVTIACKGAVRELRLDSFVAIAADQMIVCSGLRRDSSIALPWKPAPRDVDVIGAILTAALGTGAEVAEAAELAAMVGASISSGGTSAQRIRREDLRKALRPAKAGRSR